MDHRRQSGNFLFGEDVFGKSAQAMAEIMPEVLLLMKLLQTKPQVKGLNNN